MPLLRQRGTVAHCPALTCVLRGPDGACPSPSGDDILCQVNSAVHLRPGCAMIGTARANDSLAAHARDVRCAVLTWRMVARAPAALSGADSG
eukprot:1790102-Rhodomonas_salina.5